MKSFLFFLTLLTLSLALNRACASAATNGSCTLCLSDLQLDSAGVCGLYTPIDGCSIFTYAPSGAAGCSLCSQTLVLFNQVCLPKPLNCNISQGIDICLTCNTGYTLVEHYKCFSASVSSCPSSSVPRKIGGIAVCYVYQNVFCNKLPNQDQCSGCATGYTNINGICMQINQMVSCPGNTCTCAGYFFQDNCYSFKNPGCLSTVDGIECAMCMNTFRSFGFYCARTVNIFDIHCNNNISDTTCTGCDSSYILNPSYICVRDFQQCDSTFQVSPTNTSLCFIKDPMCTVFDFVNHVCVQCERLYSLNSQNVCVMTNPCLSVSGGVCVGCYFGFFLSQGACTPLPFHCIALGPNGQCSSCDNYTTMLSSGQCVFSTNFCTAYDQWGRCTTCDPTMNYQLIGTSCALPAQFCTNVNLLDASKCQLCNDGYHLDSTTQTCFQNVPGCLLYVSGIICCSCGSGYILSNQKCVAPSTNCIGLSSDGVCLSCSNGLLPSGPNCVFYDPYCTSYGATGVCTSSSFSSFSVSQMSAGDQSNYNTFVKAASSGALSTSGGGLFDASNMYIQRLPRSGVLSSQIGSYDANGMIISCSTGYTLTAGACVQTSANCQVYNILGGCENCMAGFDMLASGLCQVRSLATCAASSNGMCISAAAGYALFGGSSYATARSVAVGASGAANAGYYLSAQSGLYWAFSANCIKQTVPNTCLQCQTGFTLQNGACVVLVLNCLTYNPYGLCSSCTSTTVLFLGQCRVNQCTTVSPVSRLCQRCQTDYTYSLGVCIPSTITNCIAYNDQTCAACLATYYVTSVNTCAKMIANCAQTDVSNRCTMCTTGFTLASTSSVCIATIPNCLSYNATTNTCTACPTGYSLIQNGKKCLMITPHCNAMTDSGTCSECNTGYKSIVQSGVQLCVVPISNCDQYDINSNCIKCRSLYVLQNNTCRSMRCQVYTGSVCKQCISPFLLQSNGDCTDPNCATFTTGNLESCTTCSNGFILTSSQTCVTPITNCVEYERDVCVKCSAGLVFGVNACVPGTTPTITNCKTYNSAQTQCTTCSTGYYLPSDNSGSCCIQFSLNPSVAALCSNFVCASSSCTSCKSGYSLDTTKQCCVASIISCLAYSCSGCIQCDANTFLTNSNSLCTLNNCISPRTVNSALQCSQCALNYVLPSSGLNNCCILAVQNCQNYVCQQGCTMCVNGQPPLAGVCQGAVQPPSNNTGACVQTFGINCIRCAIGYQLKFNPNTSPQTSCALYPLNCFYYFNGVCYACIAGYNLNRLTNNCDKAGFSDGCVQFDAQQQCTSCAIRFVLINSVCLDYLNYCVNVDEYGICISCAYGSKLTSGMCLASDRRTLNCLAFNPMTNLCTQCRQGYQLCSLLGICVLIADPACTGGSPCTSCQAPFYLNNGVCSLRPPGTNINNVQSCNIGYSSTNNQCFKDPSTLVKASSLCISTYNYSSASPGGNAVIDSQFFWSPPYGANDYMAIVATTVAPFIIFQITLKGVSGVNFHVQFRNRQDSPLICWNSCKTVSVTSTLFTLSLSFPIVASQIRLYPLNWKAGLKMQAELSVMQINS